MEKLLTKIPFVKYNQCNIIHAISITYFHRVIRLSNNSFDSSSITEKKPNHKIFTEENPRKISFFPVSSNLFRQTAKKEKLRRIREPKLKTSITHDIRLFILFSKVACSFLVFESLRWNIGNSAYAKSFEKTIGKGKSNFGGRKAEGNRDVSGEDAVRNAISRDFYDAR